MSLFAPNFHPHMMLGQLNSHQQPLAMKYIERANRAFTKEILEFFPSDIDYNFDKSVRPAPAERQPDGQDAEEKQIRNYLKSSWIKIQQLKNSIKDPKIPHRKWELKFV